MDLRQLRVFEAVASGRTITGAAIHLGLAPSSVSEQIRTLEKSLGTVLFDRSPRGMRLTPAGDRLLPWARRLRELAEQARHEVTGTQPALRLGALETIAATHVPDVLANLARRQPDIAVQVRSDTGRDRLLASVAAADLDAALLLDLGDSLGDLGFSVPAAGLEFVDLQTVPLALVAAPDHRLAGAVRVTPDQLRGDRLLVNVPACSFWLAGRRLLGAGLERVPAGSVTVMRSWAERGLGISLLPQFAVADQLSSGALVKLALDTPDLYLRLVWCADRETHPGIKELLYAAGAASR